jgi:Ca2+-binding EF-hand superfamily protein
LTEAWKSLAGKNPDQPQPHKKVQKLLQQTLELSIDSTEWPREDTVPREVFFELAGKKLVQKEQALKAFQLFDTAGKGVVVLEDLQRVASELGEEMTQEEFQEMVDEVDASGEGLLSTEDFVKIAKEIRLEM